jgi:hypothetical protein
MKESEPPIVRLIDAIAGLLIGAVFGMVALAFLMLVVGSDFGLNSVRSGAVVGAVSGFFLGLCFPNRVFGPGSTLHAGCEALSISE